MAGFCGSVRLKNLPHDRGFSGSRFDFRSNERLAIDKTPPGFYEAGSCQVKPADWFMLLSELPRRL